MSEGVQEVAVDEVIPPPAEPQTTSVAQTVVTVGRYMRENTDENGQPVISAVAQKLQWTTEQLQQFIAEYSDLLALASELAIQAPGDSIDPPTDSDLLEPDPDNAKLPEGAPSDHEIALAIERADEKLVRGLRSIGLSDDVAEEALALQRFNNGHFRESMEIVSASVLKTDIMLARQQREIEQRLEFVRQEIRNPDRAKDRDNFVREERMLMAQYIEVGQLLCNIQDVWYKGSAQLALIKMRLNSTGPGGMTQRSNKPGFRPPPPPG